MNRSQKLIAIGDSAGQFANTVGCGVGRCDKDRSIGRDFLARGYLGHEAIIPSGQEALLDVSMRFLDLIQEDERVGLIPQTASKGPVFIGT
jgi:hypothetical protein